MFYRIGLILFITLAAVSTRSHAGIITLDDVGGVDNFIASDDLRNSGDNAEINWVESVLGMDVVLSDKYDSHCRQWQLIDGEFDVYASELNDDPDYFLIKLGTGRLDIDSHYLFENVGDLAWAVVDFSDAGIDFTMRRVNIGRVSHIGEFGTVTTYKVPEPNAVMMMLLVVAAAATRRFKKA